MTETMIPSVQAVGSDLLTEVVRQDQACPDYEVGEWTVRRLSDQGIVNPQGLFLFEGTGHSQSQPNLQRWAVVLKTIKVFEVKQEPGDIFYWKRELHLIQSGLLDRLPGPLATPRFYKIQEMGDAAWIWMEYIHDDSSPRWTAEDFVFTAHQIGRMDGAYLTGEPIPDDPWLCVQPCRSWFSALKSIFHDPTAVWANPGVQQVYTGENERRAKQFRADRKLFFSALDRLPQVFGHFDAQRRNLMIRRRPDGEPELVAIDWAVAGIGPVGGGLAMAIPNSAFLFEMDPADLPKVEPEAYRAYLEGLREMGWQGREELVRLGYCGWTWPGMVYPEMIHLRSKEGNLPGFKILAELSLDRADEARWLIDHLQL